METAPILFVGPNPSFNPNEPFPTRSTSDEEIEPFFTTGFDHSREASHYWTMLRSIAKDLLGRPPRPGYDYALTEVVLCKSTDERGVQKAFPDEIGVHGPVESHARPLSILMLGHPSSGERKKPTPDEIRALRSGLFAFVLASSSVRITLVLPRDASSPGSSS
jgi:hypothetical protein